jgi:hypothetical protein
MKSDDLYYDNVCIKLHFTCLNEGRQHSFMKHAFYWCKERSILIHSDVMRCAICCQAICILPGEKQSRGQKRVGKRSDKKRCEQNPINPYSSYYYVKTILKKEYCTQYFE